MLERKGIHTVKSAMQYTDDLYLRFYVVDSDAEPLRAAYMVFGKIGVNYVDWASEEEPCS